MGRLFTLFLYLSLLCASSSLGPLCSLGYIYWVIVVLYSYITEVILVYARENLIGDAKFAREYTSDDDFKEKCNLLQRSCQS